MLDIKSKNGNNGKRNNAFWTGAVIVGLAAAAFVMLFQEFGRKAAVYQEDYKKERFESEDFLSCLIQSNYILYKSVLDKKGNKNYTYEELYMEDSMEVMKEKYHPDDLPEDGDYEVLDYAGQSYADESQLNTILSLYAAQMQNRAAFIHDEYTDEIGTQMDYYVLDKESGTFLKNTMLPIEKLAEASEKNLEFTGLDDYVYYILMDYDGAGNLQNISVRGNDANRLLKALQAVESGRKGRLLPDREEVERYALWDSDTGEVKKMLTISQRKAANATFIYAMTKEQQEVLLSGYGFFLNEDIGFYSYYQSGVTSAYALFCAVILIVTALCAICRPALLNGSRERRAPFEVFFCAGIFIFAFGMEMVAAFVRYAENGEFLQWLNWNLPVRLTEGTEYAMVKNITGFLFLAVLFGLWYFCCLEISDILRGFGKYCRTRIGCVVIGKKAVLFCRKCYRKIKEQVLGVDLGEDMGRMLKGILFINFCLMAAACLCWVFGIFIVLVYSCILYWLLKKYIRRVQEQYGSMLKATNSIAQGRLNNTFDENFGVFESYKWELYEIQNGFQKALEEEVRSQRMKTELITNVSHDLKTPLTAIITYIDLLKEETITEEQRKEYLDTLERKSLRLKVLIEDLFEMSKASSGSVTLDPVPVDICHLMRQVYLEYEDKMKEAGLQVRFEVPEEKVILKLDSQKTYRIFENLYVNIIKYALHNTRVFVTVERRGGIDGTCSAIHIEMKNISEQEITGNPQELSERFVRGDASRNSEGSGLGLAIAKSLTELQGGKFRIRADGDLFKVILDWMEINEMQ